MKAREKTTGVETSRPWRRLSAWIVGLVISAFFVVLALREVEWAELVSALGALRGPGPWLLILLASAFALLHLWARAARWRLLVDPLAPIPTGRLFRAVWIGAALNNLLPARAGDLARAGLLRRHGLAASSSLATIVVERVVDVIASQILLAAALMLAPLPSRLAQLGGLLLLAALIALGIMALGLRYRSTFERLSESLLGLLPEPVGDRLRGLIGAFLDGLEGSLLGALRAGHAPGLFGWSLAIHACNLLPTASVLVACGLFEPAATWQPALLVTTFIAFAIMLPAAPGQLGTLHYAGVAALGLYAIDPAPALACILLFHASQYLPVTLAGIGLAWREGLETAADAS